MSDDLQDRYAAVERLYSQGQWEQVLQTSAALLADLPQQPGEPLRTRLLLLQGHTQLHGLGQIASAAALYHQVLEERPEPLMQAIAQQELARCHDAQASAPAANTPGPEPAPLNPAFPFVAQAVGAPADGQAVSAAPWLEAMAPPAPGQGPAEDAPRPPKQPVVTEPEQIEPVDVIEEPEQIAVLQADPRQDEPIDLEPEPLPEPTAPLTAAPRWSPAEEAELAKGMLLVVLGSASG